MCPCPVQHWRSAGRSVLQEFGGQLEAVIEVGGSPTETDVVAAESGDGGLSRHSAAPVDAGLVLKACPHRRGPLAGDLELVAKHGERGLDPDLPQQGW